MDNIIDLIQLDVAYFKYASGWWIQTKQYMISQHESLNGEEKDSNQLSKQKFWEIFAKCVDKDVNNSTSNELPAKWDSLLKYLLLSDHFIPYKDNNLKWTTHDHFETLIPFWICTNTLTLIKNHI